jgi:tricorn protease
MTKTSIATLLAIGWAIVGHAAPMMRYPTASQTDIAFVAYGELWKAPLEGGLAQRLTRGACVVSTPLFSPDGRWIAYTCRSGGLRDVYMVPAGGGEPKRLTYEASHFADGAMVVAWTPDSQRVVFLSRRAAPVTKLVKAFSVPVSGGLAEQLPLDRAGRMSFAPGGHAIAYNRIFRNLELRKRYLGGQQQDIYTYDFNTHALTRLTKWKGTDTDPMWFGRKIYFVSDRCKNFRQNIWSYDLDTHFFRQLTNFADYDVDWPSLSASTITFQQGGHLFAIDLPSEALREVKVEFKDDIEPLRPHVVAAGRFTRVTDVMGRIDYALSPHGESILLSARGDLFSLSKTSQGEDLTNTPGADEDHPSWSPNGRLIAYETDRSGSQQLAIRPAKGGSERILTHFPSGYFYTPLWSPQGDSFLVPDANHSLWWIHLDGSSPQKIAFDPSAEIRDATFSPNGRWVAYSTQRSTQLRAIHFYDLSTGQDTIVSSPMESDRSPVFTPDGRYFVFISQRNEQPFVSDRDDENLISTVNSDGLYAVALDRDKPAVTPKAAQNARRVDPPVHIDLEGFMLRAVALPAVPATIVSLQARPSALFYQTKPIQLIDGDIAGGKSELHALNLATFKDRVVTDDLENFSISGDGTAVAFQRHGEWRIASTASGAPNVAPLNLSALTATVDPGQEWAEMFENAWRLDRDVFFSKVMNGTDWQAVHNAYTKLLPFVSSPDDFLYLLGQMQGEMASSHTFIETGTEADVHPPVHTGLLGVDYTLDIASGRYRFAKIYVGDATRASMSGPLSMPGLGVKEGDYLLAVNGRQLKFPEDPDELLAGLTSEMTLTISPGPSGPSRQIKVQPLTDDTRLRRHDWIEHNRSEVDRLSHGRLGYIFLTDFSAEGAADFVRQFYPQRDKEGLIFDVRWNGGGFTSQSVLDVLRRELAGVFVNREEALSTLPTATAPRVMVTITNYGSASDGDQFPFFFRKFNLGKLVGERTWGGVQGINRDWTLMDGTPFTIPKDALASLDGHWVIENEGVAPDIPVEPPPDEAVTHRDLELEVAVTTALEQLTLKPPQILKAPHPLPAYPSQGNVPGSTFDPNNRSTQKQ